MTIFRNRLLLATSLLLYTLLLTAALLYFRFPAEELKNFCETRIEQLLPRTRCSVGSLSYSLPWGLTLNQVDFRKRQGGEEKEILCTIDAINVTPQLSSPKSHFDVAVTAWNGEHSFSLLLKLQEEQFSLQDIRLQHLDLAEIPFLQDTFGRQITGSLSGKGSYHGAWNTQTYSAEGRGSMEIERGSFSLLLPIFSLKKIDLKKLTTELTLEKDQLQFEKGNFHGRELKGEFSGGLTFQSPLKRSGFSFQGKLEPLPPLLKKSKYAQDMVIQLKKHQAHATLPFLLRGSVEKPQFKFDS